MEYEEFARPDSGGAEQMRTTIKAMVLLTIAFCLFERQAVSAGFLEAAFVLGGLGVLATQEDIE